MSIKALQEFTRVSRYARYNPEKGRRETWDEQVSRVMQMHREKYAEFLPNIGEELAIAENALKKKLVLGSQRALQFGGKAILRKEARIYNCFGVDTPFITINGVKKFSDFVDGDHVVVKTHLGNWKSAKVKSYGQQTLNRVWLAKGSSHQSPILVTANHRWILADGTETTNLSVGDKLYRQPCNFNEWSYEDAPVDERMYWAYGLVFGDGTRVKNSAGEYAYSMIRLCGNDKKYASRFEELGFKTSTNQSLSGDFYAYTGSYLKTLPHDDEVRLMKAFVRGFLDADGEKNSNYVERGIGSMFLTIQQSSKEAQDFIRSMFPVVGVYVVSERPVTRDTNFGKHDAIQFRLSTSCEGSSPLWSVKSIEPNVSNEIVWCLEVEDDHSFVMPNGITTGNCTVSYIDRPRFFSEAMWLLLCGCGVGFSVQKHHVALLPKIARPTDGELVYVVPDTIEGWSDAIGMLLSSYFVEQQQFPVAFGKKIIFDFSEIRPAGAPINDTNGKAPGPDGLAQSLENIRQLLDARLDVGDDEIKTIDAYDIVMHASDAVLSGGVRRSATICIFSKDDEEMAKAKTGDWYIKNPQRGRSNNSALLVRDDTSRAEFSELFKSVRQFGEPGFIFSDSTEALYNPCVEIGMYARDEKGNSGWSFCNLCEINVKKAKNREQFFDMCRAASILGTIQAGYTTFPYLYDERYGYNVTEAIVRREALLGCSMTGMMDNPDIAFDPEIQRQGAEIIKEVNALFAPKINVNLAARTTCVKPAGSTSCILGTASGIHPHHAKRYFRRVQANKMEEPLKFFKLFNPDAVKESVWSRNRTDDVITFLCEVPASARTKNETPAVDLLKHVQLTQQNWVEYGTRYESCMMPWLRHNVSNTINVKDDEWADVEEYIYENRKWFAGISLLPMSGDKDFAQAPFQAVYTPEELVKMYGDASVFASGLIVHALNAFGDNLYAACDCLLNIGEQLPTEISTAVLTSTKLKDVERYIGTVLEKKQWIERAYKFTRKYFLPGVLMEKYGYKTIDEIKASPHYDQLRWADEPEWTLAMRRMTYCLKDVDAWKNWVDLKSIYQDVPWDYFFEQNDNTKLSETVACAGGACEIVRM